MTCIFHLSDLHFGYEDRDALQWAHDAICAERPDHVVMTGDLTMRARAVEFAAALDWIESLPVPVTVDLGNHDLPGYHLPERYLRPYKRFYAFRKAVEARNAGLGQSGAAKSEGLGELAIVPLNTSPPAQPRSNWSNGWVSDAALERCLAAIDALPSDRRVLVSAHHPLRETGTHGTALTRGGTRALEAFANCGVVAVLSGHVHDPFDILEPIGAGPASGAVRMVGAGTLSQRLRKSAPSYNKLTWDGEALDVELRLHT
jgi:3',5'-cyclic AMP phosphodiesterase CpdA